MEFKCKLSSVVAAISIILMISTAAEAGAVPYSNCPSSGIFPVTSVDIIDSANGLACSDGISPCKIINGHTYIVEFGGCDIPSFTDYVTSTPYSIVANITISGTVVPVLLNNLQISSGDLCNSFAPTSATHSCPFRGPVCCSFRISVTAPLISIPSTNSLLPLPVTLPSTTGTIYGRAWENVMGTDAAAVGCIQIPITYQLTA